MINIIINGVGIDCEHYSYHSNQLTLAMSPEQYRDHIKENMLIQMVDLNRQASHSFVECNVFASSEMTNKGVKVNHIVRIKWRKKV